MTELEDYLKVRDHITAVTGDPSAYMRGLNPAELQDAMAAIRTNQAPLAGITEQLRANHPTLFDPITGDPRTPPPGAPVDPPPPQPTDPTPQDPAPESSQEGEAIAAVQQAETDLAQQNSRTSMLDLQVINAILGAHSTTTAGAATLDRLQQEIETAISKRTDLDTPAGARDFQLFLSGKLRQISSVIENAHLDAQSKATLAGAWTALYAASPGAPPAPENPPAPNEPAEPAPVAPAGPAAPSQTAPATGPQTGLAPYGSDPALDALLGEPVAESPPTTTAPASAGGTPTATMPSLPALDSGQSGGGLPASSMAPTTGTSPLPTADPSGLLETLLGFDEPIPELPEDFDDAPDDEDTDSDDDPEGKDDEDDSDSETAESLEVALPDGSTVTAPSPEIAAVIRDAIGGTPLGEAFADQDITVPPVGTAVAEPIDVSAVAIGDVGMFTDRQALALGSDRALIDGEIAPLASVSGPSFLGWLHPPAPGEAPDATTEEVPDTNGEPAATRPAPVPTPNPPAPAPTP